MYSLFKFLNFYRKIRQIFTSRVKTEGDNYMFNFSKSKLFLFFSMAVIILFLFGCASEPDESSGAEGGSKGQKGGDLVVATVSDVVTLDPAGANDVPSFDVQYNIFEKLVKHDENMELQPGLATSWEAIDDTTWEFKLQEGVKFHDGTDFNAEAVKANIERLLDPDVAAPTAYLLEMINEVVVVDDYTVQFKTEYPFAGLPAHLAHNASGMVSPETIEADYAAMKEGEAPGTVVNEKPIGTGYFKFEEWQPGQYVRLVKNEEYWDGTAKLDSVTFKVVPEDLTRIAELNTGDSHVTNPLSASDVEQIESTDGLSFIQQGSVSLDYLGFNTQKEPFDDKRVRRAISMAIDKKQIIDGITNGYAKEAVGPLAPNVFGSHENLEGIDYNPEEAKKLLAEAGYPDGFATTIWTNDTRERMDSATNIQAQLEQIGIDVEIEVFEWGTYVEEIGKGEHDMFILGWSNSTADADVGLNPLFHSENMGASGNQTFTDNEELDSLLDEARKTADESERIELYNQAQELLVEEAPMVYLMHKDFLLGVSDRVKNLSMTPTKMLQLKDVYME